MLRPILCEDDLKGLFHILPSSRPDQAATPGYCHLKNTGLRDLGHPASCGHSNISDTPEDVIQGYIKNSDLARKGMIRNGEHRLQNHRLTSRRHPPINRLLEIIEIIK
ncbi:MAG: hypothetical protein CO149_00685 [Nitrospirae bacterium CG_4_9_14_3_um_filter_51_5]|nr:MAG: hypothetical protein CO149_00685 [Nitrospirae bacterium CG_4_9_14_3_um_filter_51_5]